MLDDLKTTSERTQGPEGAYREAAHPYPFIPYDRQTVEQLRAELAYWHERRDKRHIRICREQIKKREASGT